MNRPFIERFEEKVELIPFSTCHWWNASIDKWGYGRIGVGGRNALAHRAIYEFLYGEVSKELVICHSCDNPSCVNPDHLFVGTHADNVKDRNTKHRQAIGERVGSSRLSESQVIEIRELKGTYSNVKIAEIYDVAPNTINAIISRRTWNHV